MCMERAARSLSLWFFFSSIFEFLIVLILLFGNFIGVQLCQCLVSGKTNQPYTYIWVSVCSVAQSCLTLCDPMDGSQPVSAVLGILQARILEWAAISSSNIYIYPLPSRLPPHSGHRSASSRVLCAVRHVPNSGLFYNSYSISQLLWRSGGKESSCNARDLGLIPGLERSFGEGNSPTHSSILAQRIPWTEEPGRLQFMGLQGVGHN